MERAQLIKELLEEQVLKSIEHGLWQFGPMGPFTNQRIPPDEMYKFNFGWAELATDLLLEEPSGGLLGFLVREPVHWLHNIASTLEQRNIELPVTEFDPSTGQVWGPPLERYPPNAQITMFVDVHTAGMQFRYIRVFAERYGLKVKRAIALVDRHPVPTTAVDGIPFASVLHVPLPLWRTRHEVPDEYQPNLRYINPLLS